MNALLLLVLAVFFGTSLVTLVTADRLSFKTKKMSVTCPSCDSHGNIHNSSADLFKVIGVCTGVQLLAAFALAGIILT